MDAPKAETQDATLLVAEIRELQAKLEAAEERLNDRTEVINDLRRLDAEAEERRRLTALLTDQRPKPVKAGSFWNRLFSEN